MRRKLAVGSVRNQKPRITPLQTTHRMSIHPRRFKIVPANLQGSNHLMPMSGQASAKMRTKQKDARRKKEAIRRQSVTANMNNFIARVIPTGNKNTFMPL